MQCICKNLLSNTDTCILTLMKNVQWNAEDCRVNFQPQTQKQKKYEKFSQQAQTNYFLAFFG